jgi:hypothetical protein
MHLLHSRNHAAQDNPGNQAPIYTDKVFETSKAQDSNINISSRIDACNHVTILEFQGSPSLFLLRKIKQSINHFGWERETSIAAGCVTKPTGSLPLALVEQRYILLLKLCACDCQKEIRFTKKTSAKTNRRAVLISFKLA